VKSFSAALLIALVAFAIRLPAAEEARPQTLAPVTVVPEADFARHPPLGAPAISPDGQHIAVSVHSEKGDESTYQLAVLHLPDLKFVSRLDMAAHYLPIDITWVDNKRLVMGTGRETAFSEAPSGTGDIIAVDIDGRNKRLLYSDRSRSSTGAMMNILKLPIGFGSISGTPDKANGHFYLTVNPAAERGGSDAQANRTLIFDVDAGNGNVRELASINADGYEFVLHDGVARYAYGQDNNLDDHVYYRADAEHDWVELPQTRIGKHFVPVTMNGDGTKLYSLGSLSGGPDELAVSNPDGSERKVLASNPRMNITRVLWTPAPRVPYAAVALDGRPAITEKQTVAASKMVFFLPLRSASVAKPVALRATAPDKAAARRPSWVLFSPRSATRKGERNEALNRSSATTPLVRLNKTSSLNSYVGLAIAILPDPKLSPEASLLRQGRHLSA